MTTTPTPPVDLATWRELVCRSFVRLDVDPLVGDARFSGRINGVERARVRVDRVDVRGDPHIVRRTRSAARADGGQLLVSVQLRGTCVVRQDDREALLRPSDFAVYDSGQCYELVFPEGDHAQAVLQLPRPMLSLPDVDDRTAIRVCGSTGLGASVSPLLASLAESLPGTGRMEAERLVHGALDLLALSLRDEDRRPERPRELLLARARAFLEAHADDPNLDPATVAAGVHVSVGHLHRLYRDTGTTVTRSLLELRVQRCATDLRDPRRQSHTLAEIAYSRGFKDAAHFTRAFTARQGMTPSEWRASAPAPQDRAHRSPGGPALRSR